MRRLISLPCRPGTKVISSPAEQRCERILGLVGLGARGGRIVTGVSATRALLQREQARLVLLASDASERARAKIEALARGKAVPQMVGPSSRALGERLGHPPVMAVGVRDRDLARGILALDAPLDGS